MKNSIKKEQVLPHSIDAIWRVISLGEKLTEWFIKADFKPEIGYAYTFTASEGSNCTEIKGKVKKASPYELEYIWVVADTGVETIVSWILEAVENGTKIKLMHRGISNYPHETAIKMFENFNGGWDHCLNLLTEYLAKYVRTN